MFRVVSLAFTFVIASFSWAGPGGSSIFGLGLGRPKIKCEYLLTNREMLLEGTRYLHRALTSQDYMLMLVHSEKSILSDIFGLPLDPYKPEEFRLFSLRAVESNLG